MDKFRFIGWFLIFGIILFWFQMQSNELAEKQKLEQQKKDSLAQLAEVENKPEDQNQKTSPEPKISQSSPKVKESDTAQLVDSLVPEVIEEQMIWVETQKILVGLHNKGASIREVYLKTLFDPTGNSRTKIVEDKEGLANIKFEDFNLGETVWKIENSGGDTLRALDSKLELVFSTEVQGEKLVRSYTFFPDSQFIGHDLKSGHLEPDHFLLSWKEGLIETEEIPNGTGFGLTTNFFSEVVLNFGEDDVSRERFEGEKKFNESTGVLRWVGLRRKYLAAVINFNRDTQFKVDAKSIKPEGEDEQPTYSLNIKGEEYQEGDLDFSLYFLPLKHSELLAYGEGYQKILFSGYSWFLGADSWYPKLCGLTLNLLNKFYSWIPNYGVAIILLTLLVRFCLLPLTITQTKVMSKQQEMAPYLKELREKYKGNPQAMFAAQRELYKEKGVSQAGFVIGCLPMFAQLPVFIALFNVLGRAVELRGAVFFSWINDLSHPDVITEALKIPYVFPLGISVLPFLMAITMYFQTKMTITDPSQKAMVYMMPVMMFAFSASFPSGLVLYWTISNVFTIVQTKMLKKPTPKVDTKAKASVSANVVSKKRKAKKTQKA